MNDPNSFAERYHRAMRHPAPDGSGNLVLFVLFFLAQIVIYGAVWLMVRYG